MAYPNLLAPDPTEDPRNYRQSRMQVGGAYGPDLAVRAIQQDKRLKAMRERANAPAQPRMSPDYNALFAIPDSGSFDSTNPAMMGRSVSGAYNRPLPAPMTDAQRQYGTQDQYGILTRGGVSTPMTQLNADVQYSGTNGFRGELAARDRAASQARTAEAQARQAAYMKVLEDPSTPDYKARDKGKSQIYQNKQTTGDGRFASADAAAKFQAASDSRRARKELARQRQFARAQMQSGYMFNADGSADLLGSMGAQLFNRDPRTAAELAMARENALMGRDQFSAQNALAQERTAIDKLLADEQIAAGEYARGELAFGRQKELAGLGGATAPMTVEEQMQAAMDFASRSPEEQALATNAAGSVVAANPTSAATGSQMLGATVDQLLKMRQDIVNETNWFSALSPEQKASQQARLANIDALLAAKGQEPTTQMPTTMWPAVRNLLFGGGLTGPIVDPNNYAPR